MRNVRTALLASAAAVALAGFSGVAAARDLNTHLMTLQLPGGGVAEIRYTGDVFPQVVLSPAPAELGSLMPISAFFGPGSPFAMLDRMSVAMDREAASLMRQAEMLANATAFAGNQPIEATPRNIPPGTQSYTMVTTWSGNGVCTQSVEITSPANGGRPHVVSHSSGNCGSPPGSAGVIGTPALRAPTHRPDIIETHGTTPYAGLVREAAW